MIFDTYYRAFAKNITRPFELTYDPYTQTVDVLDSGPKIARVMANLEQDVSRLSSAMKKMLAVWVRVTRSDTLLRYVTSAVVVVLECYTLV